MANGYNYASQGFSGAATGASAGAAFGPWGAAIGGGIGLIGGLFSAAAEEEEAERRRELLEQAAQELDISYNEIEQAFGEYYKQYDLAKAYGYYKIDPTTGEYVVDLDANGNPHYVIDDTKLGAVSDKIKNWDNQVYQRMDEAGMGTYDPKTKTFKYKDEHLNYNKKVSDFLNPYAGNVIDASNAAVQHSAAGAGLGRSTGAAKAISENTAKQYNDLYNTALNAYNQDRTQAYNEWSKYLDQSNQRLNTLLNADQWGIGQEKQLAQDVMEFAGEQASNIAGVNRERAQTQAQLKIAESNI